MAKQCNGKVKMDSLFVAGTAMSSQQSQEALTQPSSETKPSTSDGSSQGTQRPRQWGCVNGVNHLLPPSSAYFYFKETMLGWFRIFAFTIISELFQSPCLKTSSHLAEASSVISLSSKVSTRSVKRCIYKSVIATSPFTSTWTACFLRTTALMALTSMKRGLAVTFPVASVRCCCKARTRFLLSILEAHVRMDLFLHYAHGILIS